MARSKTGEAISAGRRTSPALRKLREFIAAANARGDLDSWRRGRAVLGYIEGRRVIALAAELGVTRGSVKRWLQWYEALAVEGLETGTAPGPAPKLSDNQRAELTVIVEAGPQAAGYQSGVWTGPMIGDVIEQQFGVRYHNHHVPRLLHQLGFSVQRPRKRLAHADAEAQAYWLRERFPAIKKKRHTVDASLLALALGRTPHRELARGVTPKRPAARWSILFRSVAPLLLDLLIGARDARLDLERRLLRVFTSEAPDPQSPASLLAGTCSRRARNDSLTDHR